MALNASQKARMAALAAKANRTESEETELAELQAKSKPAPVVKASTFTEHEVIINFVRPLVGRPDGRVAAIILSANDAATVGTEAITLSVKQFASLAVLLGIDPERDRAMLQFVSTVGIRKSKLLVKVEHYFKDSTYIAADGTLVVRTADGINPQAQAIMLSDRQTMFLEQAQAQAQVATWTSSSVFATASPSGVNVEEFANR